MTPDEPFFERFRRVLDEAGIRPEQAAAIMQTGVDSVRRLADGRTRQAKLDEALRLADYLGVSPHYLATGREKKPSAVLELDGVRVALDVRIIGEAPGAEVAGMVTAAVTAALQRSGIEVAWEAGLLAPRQQHQPPAAQTAAPGMTAVQAAQIEARLRELLQRVDALERSQAGKRAAQAHPKAPKSA